MTNNKNILILYMSSNAASAPAPSKVKSRKSSKKYVSTVSEAASAPAPLKSKSRKSKSRSKMYVLNGSVINCREICETGDVDKVCLECAMDKTAHGKAWEKPVCKMFLDKLGYSGALKNDIYKTWRVNSEKDTTAEHDIDDRLLDGAWSKAPNEAKVSELYGQGVSVKLIHIDCDVCMAKAARIFNHFKEPWSMVVGFYELQEINSEQCLCIKKVYLLPFQDPINNRKRIFGDVKDDWGSNLELLENKVLEAKTYKKGSNGVSGLIDDSIPIVDFSKLTKDQKKNRINAGLNKDSSIEDVTKACLECYAKINELKEKLTHSKDTPMQIAVKLSSGNNRVQARIPYKSFITLIDEFGIDITDSKEVLDNDVLGPINKKKEPKIAERLLKKKTKRKSRKGKKSRKGTKSIKYN